VVVFESRDHVAGNCHTARETSKIAGGILKHVYGPHIFHTDRVDVWEFVRAFCVMAPYHHRVKAVTARGVFSLPVNLLTLNQFFGTTLTPGDAAAFLASKTKRVGVCRTFEEQALSTVGPEIYEAFLAGYTEKQWGVSPRELDAAVLKRLPVRFSYEDSYYFSRFQGLPVEGYTEMTRRMLQHDSIELRLGTTFLKSWREGFDHVFWTGPLDAWFERSRGPLRYRTLEFEDFVAEGDFQGAPTINYCQPEVPWTRITEHKHYAPWESHRHTICSREYSREAKAGDVLYYPLGLKEDKRLMGEYLAMAREERGVTFLGRLGTYRYLDMDMVIGESLDLARLIARHEHTRESLPVMLPSVIQGLEAQAREARGEKA
jgi:UDP-galactopyranose mutase